MAMQKISSGLRINSARDDAAGIGISQRMTSQIRGLSMAMKNANDGISFVQTAEGALQEVTSLVQRIQDLAIQAASGGNSIDDFNSMHQEMINLRSQVTQIAEQTEFNGLKLLSGDVLNAEFQIGIRSEQSIRVSIPGAEASHMGSFLIETDSTSVLSIGQAVLGDLPGSSPTNLTQEQELTIHGVSSDAEGSKLEIGLGETAHSIAARINIKEGQTGVSASAVTRMRMSQVYDTTLADPQNPGNAQTIQFRLYGKTPKVQDTETLKGDVIQANITSNTANGLGNLLVAINAKEFTTGIHAEFVPLDAGTLDSPGFILLEQKEGHDISLEGFSGSVVASQDGSADPSLSSSILVTGADGTEEVTVTESSLEEEAQDSVTVGGVVRLTSSRAFTVSSDVDAENSLFLNAFDGRTQGAAFVSLSDMSLANKDDASEALRIATGALDFISSLRGSLGALQNRFESTIANLGSVRENVEAARGRVEDADFAEETAKLTKAQILQEAGIAILAQANTIPQTVLALLRA
jgi:flagellin